jgi:hypothetical protein
MYYYGWWATFQRTQLCPYSGHTSSSLALQPLWALASDFQFQYHFIDRRTPWTSDQPVARPLHRTTQTQNKHIPNIHALCGIRTHVPGFRASEDSIFRTYKFLKVDAIFSLIKNWIFLGTVGYHGLWCLGLWRPVVSYVINDLPDEPTPPPPIFNPYSHSCEYRRTPTCVHNVFFEMCS